MPEGSLKCVRNTHRLLEILHALRNIVCPHGLCQKDRKSVRNALRPPLIFHVVRKLAFLRKLFQENIQSLLVMPNPLLRNSYPVVVVSVDILFISITVYIRYKHADCISLHAFTDILTLSYINSGLDAKAWLSMTGTTSVSRMFFWYFGPLR